MNSTVEGDCYRANILPDKLCWKITMATANLLWSNSEVFLPWLI